MNWSASEWNKLGKKLLARGAGSNDESSSASSFPYAWAGDSVKKASSKADTAGSWPGSFKRRVLVGLAMVTVLFLLYRFVWLTSWYWPYRLIGDYLRARMPLAEPWAIETLALLLATLVAAQGAAILSYILFGKHKREMLALSLAGVLVHGGLGWYSYGRVAVDEQGRVRIRVVERPDGKLKVIDRDFDPETGRRARWATDQDLVMLDLERRGLSVRRVSANGPFRSPQGTIIVYYSMFKFLFG
jgi:hypothetical protein